MDHLFQSVVEVSRPQADRQDGRLRYSWVPVPGMEYLPCRLDLNFLRPGVDQPMAVEAGKAPDRVGVLYCAPEWELKPGDRLRAVPDASGRLLVSGEFEIRVVPDVALDYFGRHHIEVQIVEVSQAMQEYQQP